MTYNSRVTRPHGNSGVVKSKFSSNLPPRAFGAGVRVVRFHCLLSCVLVYFVVLRCCIPLTFDLFSAPYPHFYLDLREVPYIGVLPQHDHVI